MPIQQMCPFCDVQLAQGPGESFCPQCDVWWVTRIDGLTEMRVAETCKQYRRPHFPHDTEKEGA